MDAFEGTVYQAMGESLGWGSWQSGRPGGAGPRVLISPQVGRAPSWHPGLWRRTDWVPPLGAAPAV